MRGRCRFNDAICRRQAGLVRDLRRPNHCDCARKRVQKVAARLEDSFDRGTESAMDRSLCEHRKLRTRVGGFRVRAKAARPGMTSEYLPTKTPALLPGSCIS